MRQLTDDVLAKFDIRESKIARFVIDNGSNIVATFKHECVTLLLTDIEDKSDSDDDMYHLVDENLDASFEGILVQPK
jgi:hypothetical protein